VSLSVANHNASLPVAYRLYLPKEWTEDCDRRRTVGIPAEAGFQTKPEEQLRWSCATWTRARETITTCAGDKLT
jgi:hypothetical protein